MITTLSQLEDLADSVADIGKCGVSPLITKHHLCATNTTSDLSMPPSDSNMDCLMEEGKGLELCSFPIKMVFRNGLPSHEDVNSVNRN